MRPLIAPIWIPVAFALAVIGAGSVGGQQPAPDSVPAAPSEAPRGTAGAQQPFVVVAPPNDASYPDYKAGRGVAARLRHEPAKMITFDRASLRDVLRFLADDAGIPFVGLPENDASNKRLVTFTMEASPFTALESVCRDNGVRLSYENGVWFMHTVDEERERRLKEEEENRLVGIIYRLHYDPVDRVDFKDAKDLTTQNQQQTGTSATAIPLQNSQRVFHSKEPRIVNEIRIMLGLPAIKYNVDGTVQGEKETAGTNVASTTQTAPPASGGVPEPERLNPTYVPPQAPQVIYNSDNNTLWVVATRSQHKWVTDYLLAVDLPQDLIAIEVKFFETSKDPSKAYGINWAGTFGGNGLTFRGSASANPSGGVTVTTSNGNNNSNGSNNSNTLNAASQTGTGPQQVAYNPVTGAYGVIPGQPPYSYVLGTGVNGSFNNKNNTDSKSYNASLTAPYSAVLSMDQASLSIKAFMQDSDTTAVQYPRVLTVNNREVAISSAVNTPILSSSQTTGNGGSSTSTQQINYFPIGTQINILPKTVGKEDIAMSVAITISSYVSDKSIAGNLYPVTASRIYNASLQVSQGYTLAVGGLESTDDHASSDGIPVMRDIPLVGQLFKSKGRARNKKNLIIFITPTIIPNTKATTGISETPAAVIPIRPDNPAPPSFNPAGRLVGGVGGIDAAFAWLEFQLRYFRQINIENRTDRITIRQLRAVISTARMLAAEIAILQDQTPSKAGDLSRKEDRAVGLLTELNKVLSVAQNNVM